MEVLHFSPRPLYADNYSTTGWALPMADVNSTSDRGRLRSQVTVLRCGSETRCLKLVTLQPTPGHDSEGVSATWKIHNLFPQISILVLSNFNFM
jgi:hypothetical protein